MSAQRPIVIDFETVPGTPCPCGVSRRAFVDEDNPASLHRVDISADARLHYHRRQTEIYYILSCADHARMELDGDMIALKPGMAVLIPPGVRHRAVGPMQILNVVVPPFDPADEWFD